MPYIKKGNKMDIHIHNIFGDNYKDIHLIRSDYKFLSNILLSKLTLYADDIISMYQFPKEYLPPIKFLFFNKTLEKELRVQKTSSHTFC